VATYILLILIFLVGLGLVGAVLSPRITAWVFATLAMIAGLVGLASIIFH